IQLRCRRDHRLVPFYCEGSRSFTSFTRLTPACKKLRQKLPLARRFAARPRYNYWCFPQPHSTAPAEALSTLTSFAVLASLTPRASPFIRQESKLSRASARFHSPRRQEPPPPPQPQPRLRARVLPAVLLGVDHGDASEVDDVLHFVATLEDVDGFVHTHEHRADSVRAAEALEELVADVAGFEVRKD